MITKFGRAPKKLNRASLALWLCPFFALRLGTEILSSSAATLSPVPDHRSPFPGSFPWAQVRGSLLSRLPRATLRAADAVG
jgi:hypothetical protein